MKLTEVQAWRLIAHVLEARCTTLAYDVPQSSLCSSMVNTCLLDDGITRRTWCVMLRRVRLFAPHADSSVRALFWNRCYKAAREQRLLAA